MAGRVTLTLGDAMRTFALCVALLCLAGMAGAADDPEPPGAALRRLQGKWKTVRILTRGQERRDDATYAFEKDQVIYVFGDAQSKGGSYKMTVKADKSRPDLIEMKRGGGRGTYYWFKIEKGELYLAPAQAIGEKENPDFSGKRGMVRVLKREK